MKKTVINSFRILLLGFLFLESVSTYAQTWKTDLLLMNKVYLEAKSFQMDIEVKSYSNLNDTKPILYYKGKVASSNGNYYTSLMGRTTISNKRCILVIDNPQQMILYKKNIEVVKAKSGFSIANIDSAMVLMGKNAGVKYLVNSEKEKRIQINYKKGTLDKVELSIEPLNNSLLQIVYYYKSSQNNENTTVAKVIVNYSNVELNKTIADSFFTENNYIVVKKNKIVPNKSYVKYQVVNNSESQKL